MPVYQYSASAGAMMVVCWERKVWKMKLTNFLASEVLHHNYRFLVGCFAEKKRKMLTPKHWLTPYSFMMAWRDTRMTIQCQTASSSATWTTIQVRIQRRLIQVSYPSVMMSHSVCTSVISGFRELTFMHYLSYCYLLIAQRCNITVVLVSSYGSYQMDQHNFSWLQFQHSKFAINKICCKRCSYHIQ